MERVEVGIRELRLNLSRYVARVREGVEVIVTDRGNPVARLGPIDDTQRKDDEVYERLVREGLIIPGNRRRKRTNLPPPIPLQGEGPLVSEMVLEDRG
jgi:prevent-host-death family protein